MLRFGLVLVALPNHDHASHGTDLGHDGHIYTMPYQPVAEVVARPSRPCFHRQDAGATLRRGTFTTGCYGNSRVYRFSIRRARLRPNAIGFLSPLFGLQ